MLSKFFNLVLKHCPTFVTRVTRVTSEHCFYRCFATKEVKTVLNQIQQNQMNLIHNIIVI